jgi:UDP-N-acetylglucosamine 2-epimerase (non-hydrolysing)
MKKQIIIIASIRPDFIRLAPLIKKLEKEEWVDLKIVVSGQHYDYNLFEVFLKDLNLRKPDFNLELGKKYKTHHELAGMLGSELINLFKKENLKPDTIIFLGDSNGVLASIPLKKEGYNITHIEAGMRSGDMRMKEEINRIC